MEPFLQKWFQAPYHYGVELAFASKISKKEIPVNTLVAVAIAPFGVGDELASYVAEAIRVIRDSGLSYRTTSMFTEIEGEWDEVMAVVRDATMRLADQGIRTEVILKADIRPGHSDTLHTKVKKVEALLTE